MIILCPDVVSFIFIFLGVHWASRIYEFIFFIMFPKKKKNLAIISSVLSRLSYCHTNYTYVTLLGIISQVTRILFPFFSAFSLCASVWRLSALPPSNKPAISSTVANRKPRQWISHFRYCIFHSRISTWFIFSFYFFTQIFKFVPSLCFYVSL